MKIEGFERANEIQKRIRELKKVREWMEDGDEKNVYITTCRGLLCDRVELSSEVKHLIHGLVIGECLRLQEEFERL